MATTSWDVISAVGAPSSPSWDVIAITASSPTLPQWDVISIAGSGHQLVAITVVNDADLEPLTTIQLHAASIGPAPFDTWTWTVLPGLPLGLSGSGATISVTLPAPPITSGVAPAGGIARVGVVGSKGAVTSAQGTIDLLILPHLSWEVATDGSWKPRGEYQTL